jgi:prolyl-tRNA editing enzyme YbaK/EbsC (Cys-tRNA(Pro) deacylase)
MGDLTAGTIGHLVIARALDHPELLAAPVQSALSKIDAADRVGVAEIEPTVADTAAFCDRYGVRPDESANCVIVAARREGATRLAACVVLATTRADVNGVIRRRLGARKVSFAPMEDAVSETGMEYGGITPIGLPAEWPLLIDDAVIRHRRVVVGSGLRKSKLVLPGLVLSSLPAAEVIEHLGR